MNKEIIFRKEVIARLETQDDGSQFLNTFGRTLKPEQQDACDKALKAFNKETETNEGDE